MNFPAFHSATEHLRALGHEVVNPAEVNPDPSMAWVDAMRADIIQLVTCDAIATLPNFEKSKGASLEFHIASQLEFLHIPMGCETAKGETVYFVIETAKRAAA